MLVGCSIILLLPTGLNLFPIEMVHEFHYNRNREGLEHYCRCGIIFVALFCIAHAAVFSHHHIRPRENSHVPIGPIKDDNSTSSPIVPSKEGNMSIIIGPQKKEQLMTIAKGPLKKENPMSQCKFHKEKAGQRALSQESNHSGDGVNFIDFQGDLVGWRIASIVEFPYIVSIMHTKFNVHICTGVLITVKIVLSYKRCVMRRKAVGGKTVYKLAEQTAMIIAAGMETMKRDSEHLYMRRVEAIVTPYAETFAGSFVFLVIKPIPYSIFHRPVKFYSTNININRRKLQEHTLKTFCEVVTWEDTIICSPTCIIRPKNLKAFKVKIMESETCAQQSYRLGVRAIGEWSYENDPSQITNSSSQKHCFLGMGGRKCGSAPGGPVICGNAVYGIMSMGTSCSEFGDYTFFEPINSTDMYENFEQTVKLSTHNGIQNRKSSHFVFWIAAALTSTTAELITMVF